MKKVGGITVDEWCKQSPVLQDIRDCRPTFWQNPNIQPATAPLDAVDITADDIADASARLDRFRPFLAAAFPETAKQGGIIESPLRHIPAMQQQLAHRCNMDLPGKLLLKCDSHLPISGSIKARGGIYEVLKHAEHLAVGGGLLSVGEDYSTLATGKSRDFFSNYSIAVGSTGNLGLSIGIMGARLGLSVTVHMSADARTWKKELLRSHGVNVVEHDGDYQAAVLEGRRQAAADPRCHFVDDENSKDLFLGYSVAAKRLADQLDTMGVRVDAEHPLIVYLPCGVGGAPGGIAFGLKQLFGDHVHCLFAEPTHAPCMVLGLCTGLHDRVSVADFGIDGHTAADGLAVGRCSGLVAGIVSHLIDGAFTVDDAEMYMLLALLADSEDIFMEPSALAGMAGIAHWYRTVTAMVLSTGTVSAERITHLVWGTGGSMVPEETRQRYYRQGKQLTL